MPWQHYFEHGDARAVARSHPQAQSIFISLPQRTHHLPAWLTNKTEL